MLTFQIENALAFKTGIILLAHNRFWSVFREFTLSWLISVISINERFEHEKFLQQNLSAVEVNKYYVHGFSLWQPEHDMSNIFESASDNNIIMTRPTRAIIMMYWPLWTHLTGGKIRNCSTIS